MTRRRERRFRRSALKINGDTMTTIVVSSLLFCAAVVTAAFVLAYLGHDTSAIVDSALRVFGTELGICGIMTMFKRWTEARDRRMEERRKEKETEAEQEENAHG